MPSGRGYFLAPDGEVIEIYEHLMAVEEDPARFGLTADDVKPKSDEERKLREVRRRRILTQVLRNGFARVRFAPKRDVCEYWAETPKDDARKRLRIGTFLKDVGIPACIIKNVAESEAMEEE